VPNKKQDFNQFGFGSTNPAQSGNPQHCAQCEAMLMDALDGALTPVDQAAFDLHLLSCVACSAMVADAKRGAAWLEMLKVPRPEPSSSLLDRILAQTSGQLSTTTAAGSSSKIKAASPYLVTPNTILGQHLADDRSFPLQVLSNVLPFRSRFASSFNLRAVGHHLLQPRLAMTAAMAFFSVALTMSLTGVSITQFRASDLRPSSIKRGFSEANAHVIRYYDNLRVVYELESRVRDLQNSSETDNSTPTNTKPANGSPTVPSSTAQPSGTAQPSSTQPQQDENQQDQQDQNQQKQNPKPKPRTRPGTSQREELPGSRRSVVAGIDATGHLLWTAAPTPGAFPNPFPNVVPEQSLATFSSRDTASNTNSQVQEWRLV
jgi:hypothetical protein